MARMASRARSRATASFLLPSCFFKSSTALRVLVLAPRSLQGGSTYLVGASASSMSPLMKVAIEAAEELISSCALEMVSLPRSSSRTFTDLLFSDLTLDASCRAAGAMMYRCGVVVEGGKKRGRRSSYTDKRRRRGLKPFGGEIEAISIGYQIAQREKNASDSSLNS